MNTHYDVLGIATDATAAEVRQAYRALKNLYEDSVGTYGLLDAGQRDDELHAIERAHEALSDPGRRAQYDAELKQTGHTGPWHAAPAPKPVERPAPTPGPAPAPPPGSAAAGEPARPEAAGPEPAPATPAPDAPEEHPAKRPAATRPAPSSDRQPTLQLDPPADKLMDGPFLRAVRELKGLELDALSDALKITVTQLENIEQHRYERLPAPVYLKGFLRSYARHLGVDGDRLVHDYMHLRERWAETA